MNHDGVEPSLPGLLGVVVRSLVLAPDELRKAEAKARQAA
jgi:hypothetical protein